MNIKAKHPDFLEFSLFGWRILVPRGAKSYVFLRLFSRHGRTVVFSPGVVAFRVTRIFQRVASVLPAPFEFGMRCCDHGGQVTRWWSAIAWTPAHYERLYADAERAGDGAAIRTMTWREFFRERVEGRRP